MRKFNTLLVAVILAALTAISSAALPNTDYFDFNGWSDTTIDGGSQTFTGLGITGDIDATVTINNDFAASGATTFNSGPNWLTLGHESARADSIRFDFSRPIKVVVKVSSVDLDENVKVFSSGAEQYFHMGGLAPTVTNIGGGGIQINGNGYGANGIAKGEIYTGSVPVSSVTITHEALANFKYDQIMVGQFVPEPNSAALLGIGGFGLLLSGRKSRRKS